jgi:hypothetical protein
MISTKALTVSERHARLLFAAWSRGDLIQLHAAASETNFEDDPSPLPPSERERIDLVREIARIIRIWLGGPERDQSDLDQSDLNAALLLLRHLARCEGGWEELENGRPPQAVKEAPLPETLFFAPR